MSFSKRALLGLLVLGIFGMHGLMVSCGTTTAHHDISAASATSDVVHLGVVHLDGVASTVPSPVEHGHDDAVLVLCIALLLVLVAGAAGGRRTTWVSLLDRARSRTPLPLPPVLRDATPVPRFTVMRC